MTTQSKADSNRPYKLLREPHARAKDNPTSEAVGQQGARWAVAAHGGPLRQRLLALFWPQSRIFHGVSHRRRRRRVRLLTGFLNRLASPDAQ